MMAYGGYVGYGGMGGIVMLIVAALLVIPFWRLLPRAGIPSWVAIFTIIPLVALILLWIVAFRDEVDAGKQRG